MRDCCNSAYLFCGGAPKAGKVSSVSCSSVPAGAWAAVAARLRAAAAMRLQPSACLLERAAVLLGILCKVYKYIVMRHHVVRIVAWVAVVALGWLSLSCGSEVQKSLAPTPTAYGKINQVMVVADSSLWMGPVGDSIRFYYSSAYLILPQPEPVFDLYHVTPEQLAKAPVKKELRNYLVVADLSDEFSATAAMVRADIAEEKREEARSGSGFGTTAGRDKWAKGQLLIYMYAYRQTDLITNLIASFPAVRKRFNEADAERIDATAYFSGESGQLQEEIRASMGVSMRIPKGFVKATNQDNFMWLRLETDVASNNIMLYRLPYRSQSQLSKEGIKAIRDSLGRKYVSSTLPNTYMRVNDWDLPMFVEQVTLSGQYALEARGIWEIENDFMGGAFISYLIYSPQKAELLFIDGFLHAPGEEKRNDMQKLEHILRTIKL